MEREDRIFVVCSSPSFFDIKLLQVKVIIVIRGNIIFFICPVLLCCGVDPDLLDLPHILSACNVLLCMHCSAYSLYVLPRIIHY